MQNPYDVALRTDTHEDHLARNYDPYPPSLGGDDFAYPRGTVMRSPGPGIVDLVDEDPRGSGGRMVGVNHGGGLRSEQLHASRIDVSVGQRVDTLGALGLSGGSANGSEYGVGDHIHAHFVLNGTRLGWVNYLAGQAGPAGNYHHPIGEQEIDMKIHRRQDNGKTYALTPASIHHVSHSKELPALRYSALTPKETGLNEDLSKDDFRIVVQAHGWDYATVAALKPGETLLRDGRILPKQEWPAAWS